MAVVSNRYARAFADVVFDRKLDALQALQELNSIVSLINGNDELQRVWGTPSIPAEQKRSLLDAIVARLGLSRTVRNLVAVLIDHHRIHQLTEIARLFESEVNERLGLAEADVISARELTDSEKRDLEVQVANLTGKRVRAKYATDSNLLGGAVVKLGSTIYDGSVRGQLQRIKEALRF